VLTGRAAPAECVRSRPNGAGMDQKVTVCGRHRLIQAAQSSGTRDRKTFLLIEVLMAPSKLLLVTLVLLGALDPACALPCAARSREGHDSDIFMASYGYWVASGRADARAAFNKDGWVHDVDYLVGQLHWGEGC
jgi:hypothetical protein